MTNNDLYQFEDNQSFFVSFTDIVTLLLIFFIYLTTISNFNVTELETVSKHLSSTFNIDFAGQVYSSKKYQILIFTKVQKTNEPFSGNLYNKYLTIEFINFIRKEKKFKNIIQLKKQIKKDIDNSKK